MVDKPSAISYHVRLTRGDEPTRAVAIFAHGVQAGRDFDLNSYRSGHRFKIFSERQPLIYNSGAEKRIIFYVDDGISLLYSARGGKSPFERLAEDHLQYTDIYSSSGKKRVPDYKLTKAIGRHTLSNAGVPMGPSYDEIGGFVENSRSPLKQSFDIATVRNRFILGGTRLSSMVSELFDLYDDFHCIFCRHNPNKNVEMRAPKLKANVRG